MHALLLHPFLCEITCPPLSFCEGGMLAVQFFGQNAFSKRHLKTLSYHNLELNVTREEHGLDLDFHHWRCLLPTGGEMVPYYLFKYFMSIFKEKITTDIIKKISFLPNSNTISILTNPSLTLCSSVFCSLF